MVTENGGPLIFNTGPSELSIVKNFNDEFSHTRGHFSRVQNQSSHLGLSGNRAQTLLQPMDLCWTCQDSRTYCLYQIRGRRKEMGRNKKAKVKNEPCATKMQWGWGTNGKRCSETEIKSGKDQEWRQPLGKLRAVVLAKSDRHLWRNGEWTKHWRESVCPPATADCNLEVNNSARQEDNSKGHTTDSLWDRAKNPWHSF